MAQYLDYTRVFKTQQRSHIVMECFRLSRCYLILTLKYVNDKFSSFTYNEDNGRGCSSNNC